MTSDERHDDFRKAVADVEPLRRRKRADLRHPPAPPEARQRERDERDALDTGEALSHLRDGVPREALRKLRRGHWTIQDSVDLHGLNRGEAAAIVVDFLDHCARRQLRCVRIVHGKGHGSRNREPVLKIQLRRWLPRREEVLAFCQAPAAHGGAGAVLVLLRATR